MKDKTKIIGVTKNFLAVVKIAFNIMFKGLENKKNC